LITMASRFYRNTSKLLIGVIKSGICLFLSFTVAVELLCPYFMRFS